MGFLGGFFKKKPAVGASAEEAEKPPQPLGPPAEGMHRVTVVRFENNYPPNVNWRELVLDGTRHRESFGYTNAAAGLAHVSERFGRAFDTEEAALAAFEQRANERGNWKRVERSVRDVPNPRWQGTPTPAIDPEQEEVLDAADELDFDEAARVYADWLVSRNDPRGELAALIQAGTSPDQFLETNGQALFGTLDVALGAEISKLEWQDGFLRGAALKRHSIDSSWDLDALTAEFLKLPVARFVTSLQFGLENYEGANDWSSTLAAVAASRQAKRMRSLRFDFYEYTDSEISWTTVGDLGCHWGAFSSLDTLRVRAGGGGSLGVIDLPSLRDFERESGSLQANELDEIVTAKWPNLERLSVWTGHPGYGGDSTAGQWRAFFGGEFPKKLKHFGLVNCAYVAEVWPMLLGSPMFEQLETLDLSKGVLGDDNLELIFSATAKLSKLKSIDFRENVLTQAGAERLAKTLPNAKVDDQRSGERYRYVAVGE